MAIYHFSAKVISRAAGSSAVASAAYRSASRLRDDRLDRHHDFTNKPGVKHSEVMLPDGAPEEWRDRERLWNDVEAAEIRKDAQLAREVEFAIPREMSKADGIELVRDFVQTEFVDRGMVADLNVHWDIGPDGLAKPHAHVMLGMREITEEGFGAKVREWNKTELLTHWREAWAEHVNERLAQLDIDARIDHRSLEAQGIDLEPQHKIGPAASRMAQQGLSSERLEEHHAIARANGEKLLADPEIALDAITHQQSTFTTRDLAMFVHRHSEGKDQFDDVMAAIKSSPELVRLGKDGRGDDRFTSRSMLETEQRLERATISLDARRHHGVHDRHLERALDHAQTRGMVLSPEQRGAFEHVTDGRDISNVIGYAGTGKSAMLGVAREAWESAGYSVQGAALSGIAAENLESGSGIASRTIASLEHQWGQDRELLTDKSILVIDEAGMIGTRQMERVMTEAEKRGAKVVLVGDPEQLQAIEAGASFRSIAERHGAVEIATIRRQSEVWQRNATRQLATGRTDEALMAYEDADHVHAAETREQAREDLIDRWDRGRLANPDASRIILTHTNVEVRELNEAARTRMRAANMLGEDVGLEVERGERSFASGDRVMFLKNERSLEVKNGTLGTLEDVSQTAMRVRTDDGRQIAFDLKDYADIDHGYAATIHKAQGMTVDSVHVLATPGLDRHASYVALSRHRDSVDLHYGKDDFADRDRLMRTLSRERGKDMASDYARTPEPVPRAEPKRGIFDGLRLPSGPVVDVAARVPDKPAEMPQQQRGRFDGLNLNVSPFLERPGPSPLDKAVTRYGRAAQDIIRMKEKDYELLIHQRKAFGEAARDINALHAGGAEDMRNAMNKNPSLIGEAANGRTTRAIQAMVAEAEIRIDASNRADRFVADWQSKSRQMKAFERHGDYEGVWSVKEDMGNMAKALHRDPQLESLLRNRTAELGLASQKGASISHDLQEWLGRSRGLGISI
ncbi:Ti-type conjugative transfer relaxase TraA [Novosphingobium sp. PY1]|uniref:Ti-type conjugative transfer relaxase TraA n=1 Tax=Novosphingobium sp. PY1 TaxID=1882221 RepID=UPI001A8F874F|nr:Ti-type conjugative transfer relaxase TraA [Novosphingobium sp. PY1]GFM31595.1 conjugal transfer relaxase TraA [Novosphingobium sp. PY1]